MCFELELLVLPTQELTNKAKPCTDGDQFQIDREYNFYIMLDEVLPAGSMNDATPNKPLRLAQKAECVTGCAVLPMHVDTCMTIPLKAVKQNLIYTL